MYSGRGLRALVVISMLISLSLLTSGCWGEHRPLADFEFTPTEPEAGEEVFFRDRSVDPDDDLKVWEWDFGDGERSYEQNPVHVFSSEGLYYVRLRVTDAKGHFSEVRKPVEVRPSRCFIGSYAIEMCTQLNYMEHCLDPRKYEHNKFTFFKNDNPIIHWIRISFRMDAPECVQLAFYWTVLWIKEGKDYEIATHQADFPYPICDIEDKYVEALYPFNAAIEAPLYFGTFRTDLVVKDRISGITCPPIQFLFDRLTQQR